MAQRRNDIVASQRVQIALEMMSPHRPRGTVAKLAKTYHLSRQALYDLAAKGKSLLQQVVHPGQTGSPIKRQEMRVSKNQVRRGVLTLMENGVSQRGIVNCVAELLGTSVSLGWVNGELARLERVATQVVKEWKPNRVESLSGDEIFSHGKPNLLVVGNESLYVYALTRHNDREGDTWGCLLLEMPAGVLFASDAGTGLAAGVKTAQISQHQLDWDHLLRPLWGQVARLEQRAYAALSQIEERLTQFDQAHTTKRLEHHLNQWQEQVTEAAKKIKQVDTLTQIARQVDDHFALIDLQTGHLTNASTGSRHLRDLGESLSLLSGRIYQKLATHLQNWAINLFSYQIPLSQALLPLQEEYGIKAVAALSRLWQCQADEKRHRLSCPEKQKRQQIWQHSLDEAYAHLGDTRLWQLWESLAPILERPYRGSMLAECLNSLLRPVLNQRKQTDQGCLELFRFLHNVRPFQRGKRMGHSPAQLVGIPLPNDPLLLLGLEP